MLEDQKFGLTVLKSSSKEMLFKYFLFPFCQKLMQKQSSCEVQGRSRSVAHDLREVQTHSRHLGL
ncbi:hypothetical protein QQA45_07175, partial [Sneathia sanguinegens]|nr:hypothetical protein [Sneathia sanguinegens]